MNALPTEAAAMEPASMECAAVAELALRQVQYEHIDAALSELQRERGVRERCFPGWVASGKISRIDARDRLLRIRYAERILVLLLEMLYPAGDPARQQSTGDENEGCRQQDDQIPF